MISLEQTIRKGGKLQEIAKRISPMLSNTSTGPLIVATDVVLLIESWEKFREEAGGRSASQWLVATLRPGMGSSYFLKRADAVTRIGEHARRVWDHHAAVWACSQFADEFSLRRLDRAVVERTQVLGMPLPKTSVMRIAKTLRLMGAGEARVCARCQALEELLRKNKIPVP